MLTGTVYMNGQKQAVTGIDDGHGSEGSQGEGGRSKGMRTTTKLKFYREERDNCTKKEQEYMRDIWRDIVRNYLQRGLGHKASKKKCWSHKQQT